MEKHIIFSFRFRQLAQQKVCDMNGYEKTLSKALWNSSHSHQCFKWEMEDLMYREVPHQGIRESHIGFPIIYDSNNIHENYTNIQHHETCPIRKNCILQDMNEFCRTNFIQYYTAARQLLRDIQDYIPSQKISTTISTYTRLINLLQQYSPNSDQKESTGSVSEAEKEIHCNHVQTASKIKVLENVDLTPIISTILKSSHLNHVLSTYQICFQIPAIPVQLSRDLKGKHE